MSWATVVKRIQRLEQQGFVHQIGMMEQPNVQGKDSVAYDLCGGFPLAVGIDVEYRETRAVVTDLRGTVLKSVLAPTPELADNEAIIEHVNTIYRTLLAQSSVSNRAIVGLGLAIPLFVTTATPNMFDQLAQALQKTLGLPVVVDDVARAYALHKERELFSHEGFAILTIRSGIGLGISLDGHLYRGDDNFSGLVSHTVLTPGEGARCPRCGNVGCLETYVNERVLLDDLAEARRNNRPVPDGETEHAPPTGRPWPKGALQDLFRSAGEGHDLARKRLEVRARYLAQGVSYLILVMNLRRIFVAGHFGAYGTAFVGQVASQLHDFVPHFVPFELTYEPLIDDAFPVGAAFLVLRDYCNYEVA